MAKRPTTVEMALRELLRLVRRPTPKDPPRSAMSGKVPDDLQSDDFKWVQLFADERRALEQLRALLADDLRFECMKERDADAATWRFVCEAHLERTGDLVAAFVEEHAREPFERTCFFPVEWLTVTKEIELYGVRLLPPAAVEPLPTVFGPDPRATMASAIAVECAGTSYDKMSKRARVHAERALRVLRATLREHRSVADVQLRFRLGESVWFDDRLSGWSRRPEVGADLELDDELLALATSQELSTLPDPPSNDVERRVDLGLRWFERAQLEVDPMVELLYLFFALESILGDTSEGLKAPALAVRRAMLGLVTMGSFAHPSRTHLLYAKVRSAAVHGEEPPLIGPDEVNRFSWDVRRALNEFLQYARSEGLTKRARVREALRQHLQRTELEEALVKEDPKLWAKALGRGDAESADAHAVADRGAEVTNDEREPPTSEKGR